MMRSPTCRTFEQEIEGLGNEQVLLLQNSYDFIPISDSNGNLLVYNNSYSRKVLFREIWIKYETNGGYIGYLNFNSNQASVPQLSTGFNIKILEQTITRKQRILARYRDIDMGTGHYPKSGVRYQFVEDDYLMRVRRVSKYSGDNYRKI